MQEKNGFMEKASQFVSGKGFYIILALCAAAIGVSGYVLFFTGEAQTPVALESHSQPQIEAPVAAPVEIPIKTPEPKPEPKPEKKAEPKVAEPKAAAVDKKVDKVPAAAKIVAEKFIAPVANKEPTKNFTAGELVFDETMSDWRVHTGTDFACAGGDKVGAIGDGKVTKVFYDELAGYCVTIDHGNSIISTTRGLMKNVTVKEGAPVKMGAVIGGAGEMPSESKQGTHVHVEVTKSDKLVDLMDLMS